MALKFSHQITLFCIGLALIVPVALRAQEKKPAIVAFGADTPEERVSTGFLFYNEAQRRPLGAVTIQYGQPAWRTEYDEAARFDSMTKGKTWRFGKGFWTTMDNNIPIRIAGKEVPAGYWYLALERSSDGSSWTLNV